MPDKIFKTEIEQFKSHENAKMVKEKEDENNENSNIELGLLSTNEIVSMTDDGYIFIP
jgi:hypothetical protein